MPDLNEMLSHIKAHNVPPVDDWNPEFCGEMDMVIRKNGDWVHEGSIIGRQKLVGLFASILKREDDDYYLVTPVEKVKIRVEGSPFVVVSVELIDDRWFMTNNLGEVKEFPSKSVVDFSNEQNPRIVWRSNLWARINQSVMYQLQIYALEHDGLQGNELFLPCEGGPVFLGKTEE